MSSCLNCNADLSGRYCHNCGQKAVGMHVGLHDFFHEATHEFLHLDGKILNTVKLLVFKPGLLTKEFVEGRRARYITPLRLYLTFSVLFFAIAAILPQKTGIVRVGPGKGAPAKANVEEQKRADETAREILHNIPRVMFVLLPVFAVLTMAFYRRTLPYFIPHLYFAVHVHAFAFLVLSISTLLGLLGQPGRAIGSIVSAAIFVYPYLALRRFFGESWRRTILKGTAIGVLYLAAITGAMVGMVMLIIRA